MPPPRMREKLRCPVWGPRRRLGVDQPQQHIDTQTTQNVSVRMIPKYFCTKEKCECDSWGKVKFKFSWTSAFLLRTFFILSTMENCQILVKKYFVANNMLRFVSAKRLIRILSKFLSKLVEHCAKILNSRMGLCVLIWNSQLKYLRQQYSFNHSFPVFYRNIAAKVWNCNV